jgi:hypothetical protein
MCFRTRRKSPGYCHMSLRDEEPKNHPKKPLSSCHSGLSPTARRNFGNRIRRQSSQVIGRWDISACPQGKCPQGKLGKLLNAESLLRLLRWIAPMAPIVLRRRRPSSSIFVLGRLRCCHPRFHPKSRTKDDEEGRLGGIRSGGISGKPFGPFVATNGPAFVVLPTAGHLKIARRKAFQAKAEARDDGYGTRVFRLDVRFNPVKAQSFKGMRQHEIDRFCHVALPSEFGANPVTQIRALQIAKKDLREATNPHDAAVLVPANQSSTDRGTPGIPQVLRISFRSRGRRRPRMEKAPAGNNQTGEFFQVIFARVTEQNSRPGDKRTTWTPGHFASRFSRFSTDAQSEKIGLSPWQNFSGRPGTGEGLVFFIVNRYKSNFTSSSLPQYQTPLE